jgi:hypothetical protein
MLLSASLPCSYNWGCVQGIKATYGFNAVNARLIGVEKNLTSLHLNLATGEHIREVQFKEGK